MYLIKKSKIIITILSLIFLNIQSASTLENKILFKVDNEIITSFDIFEEIKFLKTFNPEMRGLGEAELFEISKNSIFKDKVKKIEILNFVTELKIDDKFLLRLIKGKYSKKEINSIEDFENYLKNNNLDIDVIKEKFTIELIWNDLIYQKFNKKIVINKEKIKKEILRNPQKKIQRELLLSEIIFNVEDKNDFKNKYEKILIDIEQKGFKKSALIHSKSDTAINGGLIGWIKEDNLNQNVKKIVSKLKPGQFSKPIRASSGFIIIKIEDKRENISKFNFDEKLKEVIRFKTNNQLDQFSSMYFNKLKKNLIIYGL
tara:strand:+ start:9138 stop:10082 length:945 start_codon:yes stop_codon:yes gene_type:complete